VIVGADPAEARRAFLPDVPPLVRAEIAGVRDRVDVDAMASTLSGYG
jgi:hypothetical protein